MKFTIPGDIRGKGRPRFTRDRFGNVHTYTDPQTKQYEAQVRALYLKHGGKRFSGYCGVYITACYAVPKSYSKKLKEKCLTGEVMPDKKPDTDNILKIVMDGLNNVAYEDDKQVVKSWISKKYVPGTPGLIVEVAEIGRK